MNPKQESLLLAVICLLMVLLSLGGMAYGVASGLIFAPDALFSLDGILLVLICLSMLVVFGGLLANLVLSAGWARRKAAAEAASQKPPAPPA